MGAVHSVMELLVLLVLSTFIVGAIHVLIGVRVVGVVLPTVSVRSALSVSVVRAIRVGAVGRNLCAPCR